MSCMQRDRVTQAAPQERQLQCATQRVRVPVKVEALDGWQHLLRTERMKDDSNVATGINYSVVSVLSCITLFRSITV
jgi:hypothetical protein